MRIVTILLTCSLLIACQSSYQTTIHEQLNTPPLAELPRWQSPRLQDHQQVGQIINLQTGTQISAGELVNNLAETPIVLLGEKHDNPDHHALQLWLVQTLNERRAQGSVAMEMLTMDQQATVSQVQRNSQAGQFPSDLSTALNWHPGWDWQQYAELVTHLVQQPYPLLAANLNREALMDIYHHPPVLAGAASTDVTVVTLLSEHIRDAHCNKLPEIQLPAMVAVQQQRDRLMAKVMLSAPKPAVLIAGAYHVRYDLGVPLHLHDLKTQTKAQVAVVLLAEADQAAEITAGQADYAWFTPATEEKNYCADL